MTNKEKIMTKNQIINEARSLFSQYGYDGTSIRQIAEKSGVNVAAINYHFSNKHGLYWTLVEEAHKKLEDGISERVEQAKEFEDLICSIYSFMSAEKSFVRSTMKAFLTDGVPEPDPGHPYLIRKSMQQFGPPGGGALADFLQKEYKDKASTEAIRWAVLSIFSMMIHWATMCSTSTFKSMKISQCLSNEEVINDTIIHLSRAIIGYMCDQSVWKK